LEFHEASLSQTGRGLRISGLAFGEADTRCEIQNRDSIDPVNHIVNAAHAMEKFDWKPNVSALMEKWRNHTYKKLDVKVGNAFTPRVQNSEKRLIEDLNGWQLKREYLYDLIGQAVFREARIPVA
jgi:hypothetical protein